MLFVKKITQGSTRTIAFILLLTVLLGLYFFPVLFSNRSLFLRDIYNFHYPLWETSARFFHEGELPLWNPLTNFGQNISGNPNYLLFYPPAWIRFCFDPLLAMNIFIVMHLFLGGLAFYYLCQKWSLPPVVAFWGGLLYAFSGACLSLTCLLTLVPYIFLIPGTLVALENILQGNSFRRVAFLAFAFALVVTVFEPICVAGLCIITVGRLAFFFSRRSSPGRLLKLKSITAAVFLSLVLASPVWYESARLVAFSSRAEKQRISISMYSQHPLMTHSFWIPNPFRLSFSIDSGFQGRVYTQGRPPYMLSLFIGFSAIMLFSAAFWDKKKRPLAWATSAGAVLFLLLSWGTYVPWMSELSAQIPLLKWSRYTEKYTVFASGAFLLLALVGLSNASRVFKRLLGIRLLFILLPLAVVLVAGAVVPGSTLRFLWPFSAVAAVITAGGLIGSQIVPGKLKQGWAIHLIGLAILSELIIGNRFVVPSEDRRFFTDPSPILNSVKNHETNPPDSRTAVEPPQANLSIFGKSDSEIWVSHFYRQAGFPNPGLTEGISYSFNDVMDALDTEATSLLRQSIWRNPLPARTLIMRKTGTRFLLSPRIIQDRQFHVLGRFDTHSNEPYYLYELENYSKSVIFTTRFFSPPSSTDRSMKHLDSELITSNPEPAPLDESIRITGRTCNQVNIQVDTNRFGLLVLRETFYPGWRAWDNGQEIQVFQVDYCFRGVLLQPGHHTVRFQYKPHLLKLILFISAGALLLILSGVLLSIVKEKRNLSLPSG